MTFKRPSNKRQLTFKEISKETTVAPEEVEILAMKAMSLGLVRGSIDQVRWIFISCSFINKSLANSSV